MNRIALIVGVTLGFLVTFMTTPASAGGSVSGTIVYNSGSGGVVYATRPVVVHWPNGRVEIRHIPVTHVYPNGESLIYQNGGQRVYSTGYGGAATCYVSCWHNGVNPTRRSGTQFSFSVGVQRTW